MGAEKFGLVNACDAAIIIQHDLSHILKKTLKIVVLTDSETLFNVIIRNGPTSEKRLMIDIKCAGEAYNTNIIEDIIWIRRNFNIGDAITKAAVSNELVKTLRTGKIHFEIERSIIRNDMSLN